MTASVQNSYRGGWVLNNDDEACYIDADAVDYGEQLDDIFHSRWCDLPDILLEEIFSYLNIRERYYASLVCRNWFRCFYLPRVWMNFKFGDETLSRPKYNYYSGWTYHLDHCNTRNCLTKIGSFLKGLDFQPKYNFNNFFQFVSLLSWCMEEGRKDNAPDDLKGIGNKIRTLNYVFPCNMAAAPVDLEDAKLYGTGGSLLQGLKRLMSNLRELQSLKLIDLMLERFEAKHLLDEVLDSCCMVLRILYLVNVTSVHCPIMHVGLFLNLRILVISPQNIDDDVLQLLADSNIKHLHLLQNRYTPKSIAISPCSAKAWRSVKRDNSNIRVHLRVESTGDGELLLQPEAPVYSMVYQTRKTQIKSDKLLHAIDMYKHTLAIYGHELLPKFTSPKSFDNRIDSVLLLMVRACPNINTLVIREKISTATVLLIAKSAINLQYFTVRRNAVILRCDWPKNPEWTTDFYDWLKITSRSYEATEKEVSQILGYRWTMLADKLFKKVTVHVRNIE